MTTCDKCKETEKIAALQATAKTWLEKWCRGGQEFYSAEFCTYFAAKFAFETAKQTLDIVNLTNINK